MQTDYLSEEEKLKLKQQEKVLTYCEKETIEETKKILSDLTFTYTILGVTKSKFNQKLKSLELEIKLKRKNKEISFTFYASHNDAENYEKIKSSNYMLDFKEKNKIKKDYQNFKESILYIILCDCRMNIQLDLSSFENFCNELGYNEDSIKDRDLFLFCMAHKQKLLKIFTEKEAEYLPN